MHRPGPVTMKHLAVTVLVVVLVNAQLTWWIIFVLQQNRVRLELERAGMVETAQLEAARLSARLTVAADGLAAALADARGSLEGPPPEPFTSWTVREGGCARGWTASPDHLLLRLPSAAGCVEAVTGRPAAEHLLEVAAGSEVVISGDAELAAASGVPLSPVAGAHGVEVRPAGDRWADALAGYRHRILMMVSEGAFFAVMLFVLIALLWRTLRREAELERRHRNFLSAITHELRSPLAAIRLSLETVLSGRADEKASRRFLGNAVQDAERLQDLVQKVLETTRYSHHAGAVRPRAGDVGDLVRRAVDAARPRLEAVGGEIELQLEPGLIAPCDEEALAIVLSNLIENAVKYGGSPPRVGVGLRLDEGCAVIEVSDNGSGIAREELPFVFERFYRAGDELSRSSKGTGLGLYLVQQIVRAHRGRVGVASTGSDGTIVRVELPGAELKESGP